MWSHDRVRQRLWRVTPGSALFRSLVAQSNRTRLQEDHEELAVIHTLARGVTRAGDRLHVGWSLCLFVGLDFALSLSQNSWGRPFSDARASDSISNSSVCLCTGIFIIKVYFHALVCVLTKSNEGCITGQCF